MNTYEIKADEKVCYNCRHMLWMIGIGQGVRCGYEYKVNNKTGANNVPMIPHLRHTCNKFETKVKPQTTTQ